MTGDYRKSIETKYIYIADIRAYGTLEQIKLFKNFRFIFIFINKVFILSFRRGLNTILLRVHF